MNIKSPENISCKVEVDQASIEVSGLSERVKGQLLQLVEGIKEKTLSPQESALNFYNSLKDLLPSENISKYLKIGGKAVGTVSLSAVLVACGGSDDSEASSTNVENIAKKQQSSVDYGPQMMCPVVSPEFQNIPGLVPGTSVFTSENGQESYFSQGDYAYTTCDQNGNPISGTLTYSVQKFENGLPLYQQNGVPVVETFTKNLQIELKENKDGSFDIYNPFHRPVRLDFGYDSFPIFSNTEIQIFNENGELVDLSEIPEINMKDAELPVGYSMKILSPKSAEFDVYNIKVLHYETGTDSYLKPAIGSDSYSYNF